MPSVSPTTEGFRTVFRRPSFGFAEIAWRWVFGAAATVLLGLSLYEYLRSLPVSRGDLLFLRTRHPVMISQALAHILAGSAHRFVEALLILVPCLAILWIATASLGRAATLRPLLEYFQTEAGHRNEQFKLPLWRGAEKLLFGSLLGVNFLRAVLALGTGIAVLGAVMLAGFVSPKSDPNPGLAFLAFLALASVVGIVWYLLNWLLSLATIFVVRDGVDTFGSLAASIDFFGEHTGAILWSSTAFGLMHLVVFSIASSVVFVPTMFLGIVPPGFVLIAVLLLTMLYFAVVDFLYMGRMAAYVCILECPTQPATALATTGVEAGHGISRTGGDVSTPSLFPMPEAQTTPLQASHFSADMTSGNPDPLQGQVIMNAVTDRIPPSDDDILSDVPGAIPPADPDEG